MLRSLAAALIALVLLALPAHGENTIPYGAVVRDANGSLWVVFNDQRYRLPIYPVESSVVEGLPASDLWVVPSARDGWILGPAPDWAGGETAFSPTPEARPIVAPEAPLIFEGGRSKKTDPFRLSGGHYKFRWTASGSSGSGCFHTGTLMAVERMGYSSSAGSGDVANRGETSGETAAYNVPAGQYYLDMGSGCSKWKVTIEPLRQ